MRCSVGFHPMEQHCIQHSSISEKKTNFSAQLFLLDTEDNFRLLIVVLNNLSFNDLAAFYWEDKVPGITNVDHYIQWERNWHNVPKLAAKLDGPVAEIFW